METACRYLCVSLCEHYLSGGGRATKAGWLSPPLFARTFGSAFIDT